MKHEPTYISASCANKILMQGRKKDEPYGKGFYEYARQIAAARVNYDVTIELDGNFAVQWGLDHEHEAISRYESVMKPKKLIYPVDFQKSKVMDNVGCTPDAMVGSAGLVEVKCPNSANHLENLINNAQLIQYTPQMQFQMWVTGRKWCDWVSFDPRAPLGLDIHIVRVKRDEALIDEIAERTGFLETVIQGYMEILERKVVK